MPALESALAEVRGELGGVRQDLSRAREQIAALEKTTTELRAALAKTQDDLRVLKQALGG